MDDVEEALANLRALAPAGIELCEEPVHGVDAMRAVRAKSPVPVAMDETAAERGAAGRGRGRRRVPEDRPLRRDLGAAARRPRGAGGGHEGLRGLQLRRPTRDRRRIARAAGLRASGPVGYCGLATLAAFEGYEGVLEPLDGAVAVPSGPGLVGGVDGLGELLA